MFDIIAVFLAYLLTIALALVLLDYMKNVAQQMQEKIDVRRLQYKKHSNKSERVLENIRQSAEKDRKRSRFQFVCCIILLIFYLLL